MAMMKMKSLKQNSEDTKMAFKVKEEVKMLPKPESERGYDFNNSTWKRARSAPGEVSPMHAHMFSETQSMLLGMLRYQRPAASRGEEEFIHRFILPLFSDTNVLKSNVDTAGNYWFWTTHSPVTLFSCHTDTVHPKPNANFRNNIECHVQGVDRLICTDGTSQLGADDAVGIWIMIHMIREGIPGLYIFHRGEEIGGVGSRYIAKYHSKDIAECRHAVAFDRKDRHSIITYQAGLKCCSDEFANALGKALGMNHRTDDGGLFTDTANYTDIIPECTNVSAGYWQEHSYIEHVDIDYCDRLLSACLRVDWESLPAVRKLDDYGDMYTSYGWYGREYDNKGKGSYKGYYGSDSERFDNWFNGRNYRTDEDGRSYHDSGAKSSDKVEKYSAPDMMDEEIIEFIIEQYPRALARFLAKHHEVNSLLDEISTMQHLDEDHDEWEEE